MSIWRANVSLEHIRSLQKDSMPGHLGIEFTELGPDYLRGTMPVTAKTMQPFGVLHGGASVAFAETLASIAAYLCIDGERFQCFGQEINANHLKSVKSGLVTGTTRPFHIGARSQVWGIEIVDALGRLACVSRITIAVVERTPK
ncbi:MAG TPA: hotdog fold thioesterase [Steroidobacteraceae bacterium]|nr:hotdog fold thioesterase [Steroidobacteraceae bacterium]